MRPYTGKIREHRFDLKTTTFREEDLSRKRQEIIKRQLFKVDNISHERQEYFKIQQFQKQ